MRIRNRIGLRESLDEFLHDTLEGSGQAESKWQHGPRRWGLRYAIAFG